MIIVGKNSVFEALSSNVTINKVMIGKTHHDEFSKKIIDLCREKNIRYDFVDINKLNKLGNRHQGYAVEITDFKYSTVDEILDKRKDHFIVILDGIEDPHNLGAIIRVCECAGVDGIILGTRRSVSVNDTVYKVSAGALSYVKIARVTNINDTIRYLKEKNIWVYALEAGENSLYKKDLTGNIALVMGSEGFGVSSLTKKLCDDILSIKMVGKVNSLNVSCATSVAVFEALRQRGEK